MYPRVDLAVDAGLWPKMERAKVIIDANSAPVWLALIGLVTLIVQNVFAAITRRKLETKVDQVHALANATATAGLAREASQEKVIEGLKQDKVDAALAVVAAAKSTPTVINP